MGRREKELGLFNFPLFPILARKPLVKVIRNPFAERIFIHPVEDFVTVLIGGWVPAGEAELVEIWIVVVAAVVVG